MVFLGFHNFAWLIFGIALFGVCLGDWQGAMAWCIGSFIAALQNLREERADATRPPR
jgi:hypothetical protein